MVARIVSLETERARRDASWAPTPLGERIVKIVKVCAGRPAIALVVAAPGCGKSYALEHASLEVPSLVTATLSPATGSIAGGLIAIDDALAAHARYGPYTHLRSIYAEPSANKIMRSFKRVFADAARDYDELPVIAVDEAQFGTRGFLDCLRALYDAGLASVVIAGNDTFSTGGLGPLLSRAAYEIHAVTASAADVDAFLDHRRIADRKARQLLHEVAALRGIRGVDEMLRRAGGATPKLADLQSAARTMRFLSDREKRR